MGGWALLDYTLNDASDPQRLLPVAYASILSSWALMNTGSPQSNYGFWHPGAENDGAAAGGFEPAPYGTTWLGQPHHRGSWYYGCEIDLGFGGALRAAATIFAEDPIFGPIAYGGTCRQDAQGWQVWCRTVSGGGSILSGGISACTCSWIATTSRPTHPSASIPHYQAFHLRWKPPGKTRMSPFCDSPACRQEATFFRWTTRLPRVSPSSTRLKWPRNEVGALAAHRHRDSRATVGCKLYQQNRTSLVTLSGR